MDTQHLNGVPVGHEVNYYLESGRDNPVPCDENGVSVDLGNHLGRVARGTSLRRVTESFTDIFGEVVTRPGAEPDGPWFFHGYKDSHWVVVQNHFRDWDEYLVSSDEMSRAFTLSADLMLARAKAKAK